MDRLSPLDAAFIEAEEEDRHTSMAIASIAVFEGPVPAYEEVVAVIGSHLPSVPRYRQKLRTVPWRLGPPVWVDDPDFDIHFHIRPTALPDPGGDPELAQLMSAVMAQRLDRDRPLWEYWMVTGLAGGHWALISKVHHCMVDGVSGTDLYRVMFDSPGSAPTPQQAVPGPGSLRLMARSAGEGLTLPLRAVQAATRLAVEPGRAWQQARSVARGAWAARTALAPAHRSSLSGPVGQQRHYTWVRLRLADVRAVRAELGGTINDVVLAAIAAGFRAMLLHRGEMPTPHMVPSLVPVSLRPPGGENVYDNEVSAMIVDLPVHVADPVEQLALIRRELSGLKDREEPRVGEALETLGRYVPYAAWAAFVRLGFRIPQREIVTVTTNVPGPRQTLYCLGRPLIEIIPYVPIASRVRVGVAIFSYRDDITFGITGDYTTTPDLQVLAHGIEEGLGSLLKAAAPAL
ncbi:MAG TPA: wax ester/triacylglycerol synthase family O-acyltransferase [Acidimicrobiales bacterium]|nr:wax ester/triacylglycerol synthase family O-acyltransferase [Acidimicrobiales bacterium]